MRDEIASFPGAIGAAQVAAVSDADAHVTGLATMRIFKGFMHVCALGENFFFGNRFGLHPV